MMKDIKIKDIFVTKAGKCSAIGKKLIAEDIITLEDLNNTSDEKILSINGIGDAKLDQIIEIMNNNGCERTRDLSAKKPKKKKQLDTRNTIKNSDKKLINYINNPNAPKFDILISEIPYKNSDFDCSNLSKSKYHNFIDRSLDLDPEQILYVGPSSFFLGEEKINYKDIFESYDKFRDIYCFNDFTWFHWDKRHSGECEITTEEDYFSYNLKDYTTIITSETKLNIINKLGKDKIKPHKDYWYISTSYFNFCTSYAPGVDCYSNNEDMKKVYYSERKDTDKLINKYNVIIPRGVDIIKGNCEIVTNCCWTASYVLLSSFDTEKEAEDFVKYMETNFVEFIISSETHNNFNDKSFCSIDSFDSYENIDDEFLFEYYDLELDEIMFIKDFKKKEPSDYKPINDPGLDNMIINIGYDEICENKTYLDLFMRQGRVLNNVFEHKIIHEIDPLAALKTIYGISPNPEDVMSTRKKLLDTYKSYCDCEIDEAEKIIRNNICLGNPIYSNLWQKIKVV